MASKVTSTPIKNDNDEGVELTHCNISYVFAGLLPNGKLSFKCKSNRCEGTIMVKKTKQNNYTFICYSNDHSNRKCKNPEKPPDEKELLYTTAVDKDNSINMTFGATSNTKSSEIEAIKYQRSLMANNIEKQKEEINLLQQLLTEKNTLIENLRTSLITIEASWNTDKLELEELRSKIRASENSELLDKSGFKRVLFNKESSLSSQDITLTSTQDSQDITSNIASKPKSSKNVNKKEEEQTKNQTQQHPLSSTKTQKQTPPTQPILKNISSKKIMDPSPKRKHVLIIGDEHVKDLAFRSESFIAPADYTFSSYNIPGQNINFIVNKIQPDKLKTTSVVCLVAGTHDVINTPWSNVEVSLKKLRMKCPDKKIVIVSVPPRYDNKNVHNKVINFNTKLREFAKRTQDVSYLDIHMFIQSRHMRRVHLNKTGKFLLTIQISKHVQNPNPNQVTFHPRAPRTAQTKPFRAQYSSSVSRVIPTRHLVSYTTSSQHRRHTPPATRHAAAAQRGREAFPALPTQQKHPQPLQPSTRLGQLPVSPASRQCNCNGQNLVPPTYRDVLLHRPYYVTSVQNTYDNVTRNFRAIMTTLV